MNQIGVIFPSRHSEYPFHTASSAIPVATIMRHQ